MFYMTQCLLPLSFQYWGPAFSPQSQPPSLKNPTRVLELVPTLTLTRRGRWREVEAKGWANVGIRSHGPCCSVLIAWLHFVFSKIWQLYAVKKVSRSKRHCLDVLLFYLNYLISQHFTKFGPGGAPLLHHLWILTKYINFVFPWHWFYLPVEYSCFTIVIIIMTTTLKVDHKSHWETDNSEFINLLILEKEKKL